MPTLTKKSFQSPNDTANPSENMTVETITLAGVPLRKITAQPGWKWSKDLKPVVKTETCEMHHLLYVLSGRVASRMNDGTELEVGAGEVGEVPPGHDGWVVGNEPAVWLEIPH